MLAERSFPESRIGRPSDEFVGPALMAPVGEYHDNIESAMAAGLDDAGCRARQPCLFDRADWIRRLARYALGSARPAILAARSGTAECWLPLSDKGNRCAVTFANYYNFTFRPIFREAEDKTRRADLLRAVATKAKDSFDRIDIDMLPDEDGTASELAEAFRSAGWAVISERCDVNHVLPVGGRDFAAYWAGRPGKLRSTVKRKAKKGRVSIDIHTDFSDDVWATYERVYADSWKPAEGSPEFLKTLARDEAAAGALRLGVACVDGEPAAVQFWTVENGVALIHKLAHVEDDEKLSPGTLLTHALFEHAIDRDKVDLIDFGTGGDGYKTDWMELVRDRYRLTCVRPTKPANWRVLARGLWQGLAARRAGD